MGASAVSQGQSRPAVTVYVVCNILRTCVYKVIAILAQFAVLRRFLIVKMTGQGLYDAA